MAENEAKIDDVKGDESKERELKDALSPLAADQAYQYAEILKPVLQDGVNKVKETGNKAKGDMIGALKWFKSMSAVQQKGLVDMATGATQMTKDAVSALASVGTKEYYATTALVEAHGLTKAVQIRATDALGKAQELYTTTVSAASTMASGASSQALAMANLKREEVLASETVTAMIAWSEATKKAVEESAAVTKAKETGGEALRLANESYNTALVFAEEKRVEAVQLSTVYLTAAQEQMVALTETEQGKKLQERTQALLDMTKKRTDEMKEQPLVKSAAEQLDANYKLAADSLKAAQDWAAAVLGYQKEGKPADEEIVARQAELVKVLESGAEAAE